MLSPSSYRNLGNRNTWMVRREIFWGGWGFVCSVGRFGGVVEGMDYGHDEGKGKGNVGVVVVIVVVGGSEFRRFKR